MPSSGAANTIASSPSSSGPANRIRRPRPSGRDMPVHWSSGSRQRNSASMLPRSRTVRKPALSGRQRFTTVAGGGTAACCPSSSRTRAAGVMNRAWRQAESARATSRCFASVPWPRPMPRTRCMTTVSSSTPRIMTTGAIIGDGAK